MTAISAAIRVQANGSILSRSILPILLHPRIKTLWVRLLLQPISAHLPLPILSAVIGFGGFAVIAQISPYLSKCGVSVKQFVSWRAINSALSATICSVILQLFPQTVTVFSPSVTNSPAPALSNGISVAIILLLMLLVFIFEVDNKRKIC